MIDGMGVKKTMVSPGPFDFLPARRPRLSLRRWEFQSRALSIAGLPPQHLQVILACFASDFRYNQAIDSSNIYFTVFVLYG